LSSEDKIKVNIVKPNLKEEKKCHPQRVQQLAMDPQSCTWRYPTNILSVYRNIPLRQRRSIRLVQGRHMTSFCNILIYKKRGQMLITLDNTQWWRYRFRNQWLLCKLDKLCLFPATCLHTLCGMNAGTLRFLILPLLHIHTSKCHIWNLLLF